MIFKEVKYVDLEKQAKKIREGKALAQLESDLRLALSIRRRVRELNLQYEGLPSKIRRNMQSLGIKSIKDVVEITDKETLKFK